MLHYLMCYCIMHCYCIVMFTIYSIIVVWHLECSFYHKSEACVRARMIIVQCLISF